MNTADYNKSRRALVINELRLSLFRSVQIPYKGGIFRFVGIVTKVDFIILVMLPVGLTLNFTGGIKQINTACFIFFECFRQALAQIYCKQFQYLL